ncbi:hypothetical protein [Mycobacterium innocens]
MPQWSPGIFAWETLTDLHDDVPQVFAAMEPRHIRLGDRAMSSSRIAA